MPSPFLALTRYGTQPVPSEHERGSHRGDKYEEAIHRRADHSGPEWIYQQRNNYIKLSASLQCNLAPANVGGQVRTTASLQSPSLCRLLKA